MRIIIIAHFAERLAGENDGRFEYLADMLVKRGHEVTLLTSDFDHFTKKHRQYVSDKYSYKIQLIHELGYDTNVSVKRLYSHWRWGKEVGKYLEQIEKTDLIYIAVPSLTVGVKTSEYCQKKGVKLVIDVQDLWPEAFCLAIKNRLLQKLFLPLEWYVNKIYRAADYTIAVSDTYLERALKVNKKLQGLSIFLGNDGERFENARNAYRINKPDEEFWIAYIGTLGVSYDIPCVIDAIALLQGKTTNGLLIRFVVIGDGPLRQSFEGYAHAKGVNCDFTGALPYDEMVGRMCSCDAVVNPIKKESAASIINKVGDYALSGLPVINTQVSAEYRHLIDSYQCGINCRVGNADDVANAIDDLATHLEKRQQMGEGSLRLGKERFDRRHTYQAIVDVIESNKKKYYYGNFFIFENVCRTV